MAYSSISSSAADGIDPVPLSAYPSLGAPTAPLPNMPSSWKAVALLHPFSPPLSSDPRPDNPFFQLCVANIEYHAGSSLSVQVAGCEYGTWWYWITPAKTELSKDQGRTWSTIDLGWTFPSNWFGAQMGEATCVGSSPLNWMKGPVVNWWKVPVPKPDQQPSGATWMWFDALINAPVRMMFGEGPPLPEKGDPDRLAFFQMYSFTYIPVFDVIDSSPSRPPWSSPTFRGFNVGNPRGFGDFVWSSNFGMTAFMTPVNEKFNPLPTRVLYVWKPDDRYRIFSDRAQNTLMRYDYNPGDLAEQVALLTGRAPAGVSPPPDSDEGFLVNYYNDGQPASCVGGSAFPFPQESPTWVSTPAVKATIQATIVNNSVLAPGQVVTVFSVLFPPALPNYPEATYLWTWYSPRDASGLNSRPVTFMQSQSGVGVGTSLALADYFYYEELEQPIAPANFAVPACCSPHTRKLGLRHHLP